MTGFMRWLYAHYIKPEIEDSDATGYEMALSLMDTNLNSELREQYGVLRQPRFLPGVLYRPGLRSVLPGLLRLHPALNIGLHHPDSPRIAHRLDVDRLAVLHGLHPALPVQDIQQISLVVRQV